MSDDMPPIMGAVWQGEHSHPSDCAVLVVDDGRTFVACKVCGQSLRQATDEDKASLPLY